MPDMESDFWDSQVNGRFIGVPPQLLNLTAKPHQDFSSTITQLSEREFFASPSLRAWGTHPPAVRRESVKTSDPRGEQASKEKGL